MRVEKTYQKSLKVTARECKNHIESLFILFIHLNEKYWFLLLSKKSRVEVLPSWIYCCECMLNTKQIYLYIMSHKIETIELWGHLILAAKFQKTTKWQRLVFCILFPPSIVCNLVMAAVLSILTGQENQWGYLKGGTKSRERLWAVAQKLHDIGSDFVTFERYALKIQHRNHGTETHGLLNASF